MPGFEDLVAANAEYARDFADHDFDGKAHAGVCVITCMDSRIEPLAMLGLSIGDAKVLRTPGAHLSRQTVNGCILAVHTLEVTRILIVAHTRCAMAGSDAALREVVRLSSGGKAVAGLRFGADPDRLGHLRTDVATLREHDLIGPFAEVAGFDYDVDTGALTQIC